ncbi:MAG: prepilin-type N-terminal cleavage/methylation domain-containing protein [Gemmatimonadaceae bacterium]
MINRASRADAMNNRSSRADAMNARKIVRARRGVTLMELIVALTITGMMAAVGTATFSHIIDSKRIIRDSTSDTERAAALRETIRQWLLPAQIQIQQGGVPRGATANGGGAARGASSITASTKTANGAEGVTAAAANGDEVVFTTTAPNPTNAPNARMRLFVDADEATPERGLTLEYQVTTQSPLQRRQLDSLVQSMTVELLDPSVGRWVSTSEGATVRNPKAIRLTFTPVEGAVVQPLSQLPLIFLLNSFNPNAVTR